MSRFTEHFDIDTNQFIYSQGLASPSKASFLSMSSSESNSPRQTHRMIDPILTHSFSSFDSSSTDTFSKSSTAPSSPTTSFEEEKHSSNSSKLKRFLTTISKKKRSMSNHSQ